MQDVNVLKINDGVSPEPRFETIPEHQLAPLTGEQAEVMIEELVKPVKFRFVEFCSHNLVLLGKIIRDMVQSREMSRPLTLTGLTIHTKTLYIE